MSTLDACDFDFGLGETLDEAEPSACLRAPRSPPLSRLTEATSFTPVMAKAGRAGLHGLTVPERWGGADLGYLAHIVAMEEICSLA
jgi:isovaleryl-CoA dehydrogenase